MTRRSQPEMGAMEVRISNLITALRESGDPVQLDLAGRLWRCAKQRQERRDGLRDRVDRPCRQVACEHCRRWRGREWRRRATEQMASADNDHSSLVTIMITCTGSLESIRDIIREFRVSLRNLRDRRAREDGRWRMISAVGLAEVDMVSPYDIQLLPPHRRQVIETLSATMHGDEIVHVVHVHLAASHPAIPRHVVKSVLSQQWPGNNRVDVKPFRDEQGAADNAGGVVAYASKQKMSVRYSDFTEFPVPIRCQASYFGWLHGIGAGLATLRVRMSEMRNHARNKPHVDQIEPMPIAW